MSLFQKTFKGVFWTFFEAIFGNGINFLVLLYLARVIGPSDFGIIGISTIFISVSMIFVDGGLSTSLLRQKKCSNIEYSTLFYFNLIVSFLFFLILFFSSENISIFFNESILKDVLKALSILLIINSFSTVQRTYLMKKFDFKSLYKSSAIASFVSGVFSIYLVSISYGIWSVVVFQLLRAVIYATLLWYYTKWKPLFKFSIVAFKKMWNYGNKLLLSGLLNTGYENLYILIIGKLYSTKDLALYDRANQIQLLISIQLDQIISKVSFPLIAEIQDQNKRLKIIYSKIISHSMFISIFLMMFISSIADNLVLMILGNAWVQSGEYLKLLCFAGMVYPLHTLNLNLLKVKGSSSLFLKLEIIKKIFALPIFYVAWKYSILYMIYSILIYNIIGFLINSYYSGSLINLNYISQIKLFLNSLSISLVIYLTVTFLLNSIILYPFIEILLAIVIWISFSLVLLNFFKNKEFSSMVNILKNYKLND